MENDDAPYTRTVPGLAVTFHGVRGSTPYSAPGFTGFGGNTCCVVVEIEGEPPIILDMGTGLFGYARTLDQPALVASVLLTHLHWDHVAGLPFFAPALSPGGRLEVFGPADAGMNLDQAINRLIQPPFFPVTMDDFAGEILLNDLWNDDIAIGSAKVRARPVPHTNATSGYRIEAGGASVVYVPDHQQPIDDARRVPDSVLELCDGADLLIHDGQYPPELFAQRAHWGHSTPGYAVEVARQSGVRSLALFSHDPMHSDADLEAIEADAQRLGRAAGLTDVFSSREGMRIELG